MTTFMFWNLFEGAWELQAGDDTRWRQQVAVVERERPDVLAITEGWDWHDDDQALFRRAMADLGYHHGELYEAKTTCDMAVMWNDPVSLVKVQRQPLSEAWWHGYMRVTLALPDSSEPFTLMVSHMNPFDPTLRTIEASWLRTQMVHTDHGVLVMDANCPPPGDPEPAAALNRNHPGSSVADREGLEGLAAAGLVDIGAAFGDRTPTHGHMDQGPRIVRTDIRLDQAWATPSVQVEAYRVLDDEVTRLASDHLPITFTAR